MGRPALVFAAGALLGGLLVWLLAPGVVERSPERDSAGETRSRADVAAVQDELEALRASLDLERAMRDRLAAELDRVRAGEGAEGRAHAGAIASVPEAVDAARPGAGSQTRTPDASERVASPSGKEWFSSQRLLAVGVKLREVERIREAWQRFEMEKLYINDAVARGELKRAGGNKQKIVLRYQLKELLGEDGYDAMLYAAGAKNRVVLEDVLASSPAAVSGLQPGDEVLRYDGRRVFLPREIKQWTAEGEPGETVALDILRGGQTVRLYVDRGPLGVRLKLVERKPYSE